MNGLPGYIVQHMIIHNKFKPVWKDLYKNHRNLQRQYINLSYSDTTTDYVRHNITSTNLFILTTVESLIDGQIKS